MLIICTGALRLFWAREAQRWLTRPLSAGIADVWLPQDPLVIAPYEILRRWRERLLERDFDLVVLDDAHLIKSSRTLRSKLAAEIAARAPRRLLLTGAPLFDRPVELYPLLKVLDPSNWPSFFEFAKRYCAARHTGTGWDFAGSSNIDELQDLLRQSVLVRRRREDVLTELPGRRRQAIELPAGDAVEQIVAERERWRKQQGAMDLLRAQVELAKTDENPESYRRAVEDLAKGTRAAFGEIAILRHATALAKVPRVVEHVKALLEEREKVVVFAQNQDILSMLQEALADVGAAALTPETPPAERAATAERFQKDPVCRVLVASIAAAGPDITLSASSHAVFAELDHVPGNVTRAEDLCHQAGRRDFVLVQHLVLEGSLDATLARALVEKQEAADHVMDTDFSREVVAPGAQAATRTTTRRFVDEEAMRMTPERGIAVGECLRLLLGQIDGTGATGGTPFNELDIRIIRELAGVPVLSPRQASLGCRIAQRYAAQLPEELLRRAKGEAPVGQLT